jgi:hypothetical protein
MDGCLLGVLGVGEENRIRDNVQFKSQFSFEREPLDSMVQVQPLRGRTCSIWLCSGPRQDQAHGVSLPNSAALAWNQALVELAGNLPQR